MSSELAGGGGLRKIINTAFVGYLSDQMTIVNLEDSFHKHAGLIFISMQSL